MKKIVILGAGFGGLETATGLSEALTGDYQVTLIDKRESFFIGFSKIDVMFGHRSREQVCYRYDNLRAEGVRFVQDTITAIDTDARRVTTEGGSFDYDYLVVALGATLDNEAIPGFVESGAHEFYSLAGAERLRPVVAGFERGTLVLGVFRFPYKCPPAPYEVALCLHDHFVARGVRDAVTLKMVIPKPRPVGNPKVSDTLEALLAERDIELLASTTIEAVDAANRRLKTSGDAIDYDLFIGVPVHRPPTVVRNSKLTDAGYIVPDKRTLETHVANVYAVGDVTKIPVGDKAVPKAGAFAEDAARTVVGEILRKEGLADTRVPFNGRGACYFEFGGGRVAKVDANYLEGDKPNVRLEGPDESLRPDKLAFEVTRRDRWFTSD
jgi:sulfide:quinone oxidoreductase